MSDQGRRIDWRLVKGKSKYRGRFYDCHEDQKEIIVDGLNKARSESGTKHDTVALELICLNYLSGATVKPPELREVMQVFGLQEVLIAMQDLWPNDIPDELSGPHQLS